MTDNGICVVLIFVEEVGNARESNLIDVLVDFFLCHTYTAVADSKCSLISIKIYVNCEVAKFAFKVATFGKCLNLLCCVNSVGNHFAKENFMI